MSATASSTWTSPPTRPHTRWSPGRAASSASTRLATAAPSTPRSLAASSCASTAPLASSSRSKLRVRSTWPWSASTAPSNPRPNLLRPSRPSLARSSSVLRSSLRSNASCASGPSTSPSSSSTTTSATSVSFTFRAKPAPTSGRSACTSASLPAPVPTCRSSAACARVPCARMRPSPPCTMCSTLSGSMTTTRTSPTCAAWCARLRLCSPGSSAS
mmetsp:Transcript_7371/g.20778  ORF Transcript_7371/g.20778 Transcript_7371/m.20778 type:complete len:215 (+) Transcript_7371:305-949(+)